MSLTLHEMQKDYHEMMMKLETLVKSINEYKASISIPKLQEVSGLDFIYDRMNLPYSLSGEYSFFSYPLGSGNILIRYETVAYICKTYRDTNMHYQGSDNSIDRTFYGISTAFIPSVINLNKYEDHAIITRDIFNIMMGAWILFKVVDMEILRCPLFFLPVFNKNLIDSIGINDKTLDSVNLNQSLPYLPFKSPIKLDRGTYFSAAVGFDGAITLSRSYDMYLILSNQNLK